MDDQMALSAAGVKIREVKAKDFASVTERSVAILESNSRGSDVSFSGMEALAVGTYLVRTFACYQITFVLTSNISVILRLRFLVSVVR